MAGGISAGSYAGVNTPPSNGMIISGNVGIGTTNPTAKLEVAGTAGTDGIKFPDGILQTSGAGSKRCRVYNSAAQSIPDNICTMLNFDSESWDTDNIHDNVTNNTRLTCRTAGLYIISGSVHWACVTGGRRSCRIYPNGSDIWLASTEIGSVADANSYPAHSVTTIYYLNVGDYVEFSLHQTSGGSVSTYVNATCNAYFMMARIGD